MNRLLHAAARGARIQALYQRHWIPANYFHLVGDYTYRIHPDDAHLQYGPVSTALRKKAETPNTYGTGWDCFLANSFINEFSGNTWEHRVFDYPLFYLFLAEFLADEGM